MSEFAADVGLLIDGGCCLLGAKHAAVVSGRSSLIRIGRRLALVLFDGRLLIGELPCPLGFFLWQFGEGEISDFLLGGSFERDLLVGFAVMRGDGRHGGIGVDGLLGVHFEQLTNRWLHGSLAGLDSSLIVVGFGLFLILGDLTERGDVGLRL